MDQDPSPPYQAPLLLTCCVFALAIGCSPDAAAPEAARPAATESQSEVDLEAAANQTALSGDDRDSLSNAPSLDDLAFDQDDIPNPSLDQLDQDETSQNTTQDNRAAQEPKAQTAQPNGFKQYQIDVQQFQPLRVGPLRKAIINPRSVVGRNAKIAPNELVLGCRDRRQGSCLFDQLIDSTVTRNLQRRIGGEGDRGNLVKPLL